jgi:hypothetical protein
MTTPVVAARNMSIMKLVVVVAAAAAIYWMASLNLGLYKPGRLETAVAQLRFLSRELERGGAERMQSLFPEGYVFTWALYGLAWTNVARALPSSDSRRLEALTAAHGAIAKVNSEYARSTFNLNMEPMYGAFYSSWSLYLRSSVLRTLAPDDLEDFDLVAYELDCERFASSLSNSDTPFLASYYGAVWPADTVIGLAALAIRDSVLEPRYGPLIQKWIVDIRHRLDPELGAIPHAANLDGFPLGGPRGESLALMSLVLADVDTVLSGEQFDILRSEFVDYTWLVPGVREYPHGVSGEADIDSGPIILGYSGPATVVGAGAAIANGDEELATNLLAIADAAGFPIEIDGRRSYAGGLVPVGDAFLAWARTAAPRRSSVRGQDRAIPATWRLPVHLISLVLVAAAMSVIIKATQPIKRNQRNRH